jgi:radical SAM superfamily enzyme YgiQ (UPF0313 family)
VKIQYIYPTQLDEYKQPLKYKKALLPPLALAILDSLTPPQHQVKIVNDVVEKVDFSPSYDLVALTGLTSQIERVYQIADHFRELGVKVVIGGFHATALPHEAKKHADAVFIGEMGRLWEHILVDAENNRLKEFYQEESLPKLKDFKLPRWDRMNLKIYFKALGEKLPPITMFTTRGCQYNCKFCSISKFFHRTYRTRPISKVLQEIDSVNAKNFVFVDDNTTADANYSRELFKALIPKKIRFYTQISTTVLKNPELIDLAAKAGCLILTVGIESFNKDSLQSLNKGFNNPEAYAELFDRMRRVGIIPIPTIMMGIDGDSLEQFQYAIDFLMKHKVGGAWFGIMTPLPGTELYREMEDAGRIITRDWTKYDLGHLVFQPRGYSVDEFHRLFWKYYRSYFTFGKIAKKISYIVSKSPRPFTSLIESIYYSLYCRKQVYNYNVPISGGLFQVRKH